MLPKVISAYDAHGYGVDMGNPSTLFSCVVEQQTGRRLSTGGGISVSDAFLFTSLARIFDPSSIFVVGNAFGLSTFVLAETFPSALIDVIDAEIEGGDNAQGSALTRQIARTHFPKVQLTTGFSPEDVPKACRAAHYQMAFIDGLHTDEQMVKDFLGIRPYLSDECLVIFHDVASHNMLSGWNNILQQASPEGFRGFEVSWTSFGVCVLVRGLPAVNDYFTQSTGSFSGARYHLGIKHSPQRPKFYNRTLFELELALKRRLGWKA